MPATASPAAPAALPTATLVSELITLTGQLNAAQHRFLVLLAEFDRRKAWSDGATHSCAHWLNWKLGIDLGAAREKVRVAHALAALPSISAAMARGELSYSKVRALTRVADAATEAQLLNVAKSGTAWHVERVVRAFRRARESVELDRERRQHAGRGAHYRYDDDGSLLLTVRLPAESGAALLKALQCAEQSLAAADVSAETPRESGSARRADALVAMAESFLAHGLESLPAGDRHQVVVHVDADALRGEGAARCELDDGPALAVETARRLCCDASLVRLTESTDGTPLDLGRKTRAIPPALQRALAARDRGCRFPGCTRRHFVDGHHIQHWADGGATRLDNLVSLCRFHHRQVHEGGFRIERLDDGALRFLRPDGRALEGAGVATRGEWTALGTALATLGHDLRPTAAATGWRGERLDLGLAVGGLMLRWQRARREVSAETSAPLQTGDDAGVLQA